MTLRVARLRDLQRGVHEDEEVPGAGGLDHLASLASGALEGRDERRDHDGAAASNLGGERRGATHLGLARGAIEAERGRVAGAQHVAIDDLDGPTVGSKAGRQGLGDRRLARAGQARQVDDGARRGLSHGFRRRRFGRGGARDAA